MQSHIDPRAVLAVPLSSACCLFSSLGTLDWDFRRLAKACHPDSGGSVTAFQHLVALRAAANADPNPCDPATVRRWSTTLSTESMQLRTSDNGSPIGCSVTHVYQPSMRSFCTSSYESMSQVRASLSNILSAGPTRDTVLHSLPREGAQGGRGPGYASPLCSLQWTSESCDFDGGLVRLADLLAFYGGSIPVPHASWIISRLLDFCCAMEAAGYVHGGLLEENIYVVPATHDISILGGWEFTASHNNRMVRLQDSRVIAVLPPAILRSKSASHETDLALVVRLGSLMLGDQVPPTPISDFLCFHRSGGGTWIGMPAAAVLREWRCALDAAGGRRFTLLDTTASRVYMRGA